MSEWLSTLLAHQNASLVIRSDGNGGLEGELAVAIRGYETFTVSGRSAIEHVVSGLQDKFLRHDWSKGAVRVDIHGGIAEVMKGDAMIVDWDILQDYRRCPACRQLLGSNDVFVRVCPHCHFTWEESDE